MAEMRVTWRSKERTFDGVAPGVDWLCRKIRNLDRPTIIVVFGAQEFSILETAVIGRMYLEFAPIGTSHILKSGVKVYRSMSAPIEIRVLPTHIALERKWRTEYVQNLKSVTGKTIIGVYAKTDLSKVELHNRFDRTYSRLVVDGLEESMTGKAQRCFDYLFTLEQQ